MGATLDALLTLQKIERRLAALRDKADDKRRQIRVHKRALERQDQLIAEKDSLLKNNQLEIDRIDLTVKSMEVTLDKHREALNRARTNKEYAAILTTLNTEKADNAKLESRQLQLMAELDQVLAEKNERLAEREKIVGRVKKAEAVLEKYLQETAGDTEALQSHRQAAASGINPSVLTTFERVAERHGGEAMAEVATLNVKRHEYACSGCNMQITLEQNIGVQTRDDLQVCASCGKILYVDKVSS